MRFDTYIPCDALKPFIKHFIITEQDYEETYRVLPGTSVVMGFQYRGGLSFAADGTEHKLAISGITGLMDSYRIFKNTAGTGTILVVFKEAQAAAFFTAPMHELFGESLALDDFIPRSQLSLTEEQISEADTDKQRISIIEQFLLGKLHNTNTDKIVTAALLMIHQARGAMRITDLAEKLCISQSPLEKRFRKAVGISPKKFSSIVRLENVISLHQPGQPLTTIYYDAGYFDQAHFIKDFKSFTGQTPEDFFFAGK